MLILSNCFEVCTVHCVIIFSGEDVLVIRNIEMKGKFIAAHVLNN